MKFFPEYTDIENLSGQFDIAPVSCEILADFITPMEALRHMHLPEKQMTITGMQYSECMPFFSILFYSYSVSPCCNYIM